MNTTTRRQCLALASLLLPVAASAEAQSASLQVDAAHSMPILTAGPADARAGIVLVHDWFGVSPFFLQGVERLGRQGYRALGVDLYDGRRATSHEEAARLMNGLDPALAAKKIDAALRSLSARGRKLGLIGFSMGGRPVLEAALRHKEVAATAVWYGETVNDPTPLKKLGGPVLFIVGSHDGEAAVQNAAAFSAAADAAGAQAEIHIFPGAAHAFAQPLFNQGKTYDAQAAEAAWQLTEGFMKRHLK